jgi:hypothetical protein
VVVAAIIKTVRFKQHLRVFRCKQCHQFLRQLQCPVTREPASHCTLWEGWLCMFFCWGALLLLLCSGLLGLLTWHDRFDLVHALLLCNNGLQFKTYTSLQQANSCRCLLPTTS